MEYNMENIVTIVKSKPSDIEFELSIDGLDKAGVKPKLCIITDKFHIALECKHIAGDKWKCDIPALDFLEVGNYDFKIEVVAEGYFFTASDGKLNLAKSHDIYVKGNTTKAKPTAKQEDNPKDVKVKDKKDNSDAEKAAEAIMANMKKGEKDLFENTPKPIKKAIQKKQGVNLQAILGESLKPKPVQDVRINPKSRKFGSFLKKGKQVRVN